MEDLQSLSDKVYTVVEWTWKNGGWWAVIGGILCILLVGMKMRPEHQRRG